MKSKFYIVCLFFFLSVFSGHSQSETGFHVLFYNAENLFDTVDDPETNDDEFTPEGERHWTNKKLNKKLLNLSKVLLNVAGWEPPGLVALCEVENRFVLEQLIKHTPLKKHGYNIIHKDSPDERGIDVSLLYKEDSFYPLGYKYYSLNDDKGNVKRTREILYVKGVAKETDTLHIYINHWPSRYSGLLETAPERKQAAVFLHNLVRKKMKANPGAKVIITGDFNDGPNDESLSLLLAQESNMDIDESIGLVNCSANFEGTLKYQSQWFTFDQFIVSKSLLAAINGLSFSPGNASVIRFPYLLEEDEKYGGSKPFRTYSGFKYNSGFSDHLPVVLRLDIKN